MSEKEFTPVAAGWVACDGRYLKEILRLNDRAFYLYEGPEGFGIASLITGGGLRFSAPLPERDLIDAARDLAAIADANPFNKLMAVGMDLERHGVFPDLALDISTDRVSLRLRRFSWSVKGRKFVEYYAEVDTLGVTLNDVEFRLLFPALARALGAR
jgi:hypothetical protein